LKHQDGSGQNWPDAEQVNGHIDGLAVVRRIEGELLLQVESVFNRHHRKSLKKLFFNLKWQIDIASNNAASSK
jgi:hypothetical protein